MADLVDRLRLMTFPLITGGLRARPGLREHGVRELELVDHRTLDGWVLLVEYRPTEKTSHGPEPNTRSRQPRSYQGSSTLICRTMQDVVLHDVSPNCNVITNVNGGERAPTSVRDLVVRFYCTLWNEWDDSAVDDTLAPGVTFRGSLGQRTIGRDGWRSYRDQIRRAAPDFHNELLDVIIERHRAAARLQYTGTHLGPLLGIPATGRTFTYTGAAFFTTADGLITDIWVVGDLDELRRQLL